MESNYQYKSDTGFMVHTGQYEICSTLTYSPVHFSEINK